MRGCLEGVAKEQADNLKCLSLIRQFLYKLFQCLELAESAMRLCLAGRTVIKNII